MRKYTKSFSPLKQVYHYNSVTKELELVEGETVNVDELINSYPVTTLDHILDYGLDVASDDTLYLLEDYRDKLDIAREAEEFRLDMVEKYKLPFDTSINDVTKFIKNQIINEKEKFENEIKKKTSYSKEDSKSSQTSEEA